MHVIIVTLTLLSVFISATGLSATLYGKTLSGRIESSYTTFYDDGSGRLNKLIFSTTDGMDFVLYSKQVFTIGKGDLVDIHLSPLQSTRLLLACAFEVKGIQVVLNGVADDLMFKKPLKFKTAYGKGCN